MRKSLLLPLPHLSSPLYVSLVYAFTSRRQFFNPLSELLSSFALLIFFSSITKWMLQVLWPPWKFNPLFLIFFFFFFFFLFLLAHLTLLLFFLSSSSLPVLFSTSVILSFQPLSQLHFIL